jgi:hypothetical protein
MERDKGKGREVMVGQTNERDEKTIREKGGNKVNIGKGIIGQKYRVLKKYIEIIKA